MWTTLLATKLHLSALLARSVPRPRVVAPLDEGPAVELPSNRPTS
jgi:hypothetical protein